jgi:hypothetical protein
MLSGGASSLQFGSALPDRNFFNARWRPRIIGVGEEATRAGGQKILGIWVQGIRLEVMPNGKCSSI